MFTGIVEETGSVENIVRAENSIRLGIRASLALRDAKIGDSIAVNGCCLTVVKVQKPRRAKTGGLIEFDLLNETWQRTNLQFVRPGSLVNLERSLSADGRLHGHFVTGHIDGLGLVKRFEQRGHDRFLEIKVPASFLRYIVLKGAVAIDGISLTVAEVKKNSFSIWIIPHTAEVTALKERSAGQMVNLEADILAKYTERLLAGKAVGE